MKDQDEAICSSGAANQPDDIESAIIRTRIKSDILWRTNSAKVAAQSSVLSISHDTRSFQAGAKSRWTTTGCLVIEKLFVNIMQVLRCCRSIVNEAAERSSVKPMVNMGQGFFGYNPPEFVLNAARDALSRVECNQYSPTKVCCSRATYHTRYTRLNAPSRDAHA